MTVVNTSEHGAEYREEDRRMIELVGKTKLILVSRPACYTDLSHVRILIPITTANVKRSRWTRMHL